MPFLVNVKNNTGFESTVQLFNAFNSLTNNTEQYFLTTTAGGTTTTVLDFSTAVDANGNFFDGLKASFWRDAANTTRTLVSLDDVPQYPFSALEESFNTNTNWNLSGSNVDNGGAQIQVRRLTDDYSQVAITITNPPNAPYDFYEISVAKGDPAVQFDTAFFSLYNTLAPPVGAGISIEDNAYGNGAMNYREFLREVTVNPILFSKMTATFSNKSDAFGLFTMKNNTMNTSQTQNIRMQRSPYMNFNTYVSPVRFAVDGFFGLDFQISPFADINLKFWDEKQVFQNDVLPTGVENNILGV